MFYYLFCCIYLDIYYYLSMCLSGYLDIYYYLSMCTIYLYLGGYLLLSFYVFSEYLDIYYYIPLSMWISGYLLLSIYVSRRISGYLLLSRWISGYLLLPIYVSRWISGYLLLSVHHYMRISMYCHAGDHLRREVFKTLALVSQFGFVQNDTALLALAIARRYTIK